MPARTLSRQSYTVGIICALDVEKAAVEATLDEEHGRVEKAVGDDNAYTFGRIGAHNVVVACLPAGVMGKVSATAVAKDMMRSFPIKVGLMVGICGGVWSERADVRLGDVVVSQPDGQHGGVVQWDYGKMERDGVFRRTGTLNKPPRPLLNAVQSLKARHMLRDSEVKEHLAAMFAKYPRLTNKFGHQGQEHDELFEASYGHPAGNTCGECDRSRLCNRAARTDDHPQIHYGNIASGDQVVKDGPTRDRIAREEGILCFEMEAAGLMDTFPCVVIRGVCDYADSHKNKRWQPYAAATAACYAKELLGEVDAVELEQLRLASYRVPFSMAGLPTTDHFVQRAAEMARLDEFFKINADGKQRKVFVVHGLGGMGKTQLCVEYARRRKEHFTAVFWLDGSSKDALRQSLGDAAKRAGLTGSSAHDVHEAIAVLHQWLSLEANTSWLLVLDNVDREWQGASGRADPQAYDFKDFFPPADHGNVLITTRLGRLQRAYASLRMSAVDNDVGREMLESRAGTELADADLLQTKLGGLPLALVQAGAYIGATGMTVEEYIADYDETWDRLMDFQNQDPYTLQEYAERSVLTTWKISYEHVREVNTEAATLLDQWAFLDPANVAYDLIGMYNGSKDQDKAKEKHEILVRDRLSFRHAVGVLAQYSLVNGTEDTARFSIHGVVHDWSLYNITDDQARERLCARAIRMVSASVPSSNNAGGLQAAQRLLSHSRITARRLTKMEGLSGLQSELHQVACFMQYWERSQDVETLFVRALQGYEEARGAKHTSTLGTVNNLGLLYWNQGKMKKAEEMFMRALKGREEAWGAKHTSTLDSVNNLGNLYADQGKLKEAEEMYLRALRGKEEAWGAKHTSTLDTINNLGVLYARQGRLEEAKGMYLRALTGREEAWGKEHVLTLETVNNLAALNLNLGKTDESEKMFVRALKGYEEALGAKHMSTLNTINNLGTLYAGIGKLEEAEALYVQALRGYEEALGEKHFTTLEAINNLGTIYADRGNLGMAEGMLLRALKGYKEALGGKHTSAPDTATNLGTLYWKQGKMKEAEEMYLQALRGYEEARGAKHTSTLRTVNNLGLLYKYQGKTKEAEEMYLRALRECEEALGAKHTSTLQTVNNLGNLYRGRGDVTKAKKMYERAVDGYSVVEGDHEADIAYLR